MNIHFLGNITHKEVCSKDINRVKNAAARCIENYKGSSQLDLLMFGVAGYDDDPRALFNIAEVREWAKVLRAAIPYILDLVEPITLNWLLPCVADIEITKLNSHHTAWRLRSDSMHKFINEMFEARFKLFNYLASSQEEFDALAQEAFERHKKATQDSQLINDLQSEIRKYLRKRK